MTTALPETHPVPQEEVESALTAIYSWNYESEIDELRTLYANALERQWIALRDLDWEQDIDQDAFSRTFTVGGFPIQKTRFWQNLPADTRWEVSRRTRRLHALELPARRAGSADGGGTAGERRAPHGRQVLRLDADHGRGPPRRGLRRLHPQARTRCTPSRRR